MTRNPFTLFGAALALALPLAWPTTASAQTYPDRPVRVLHGFAAGGNADVVARLVGAETPRSRSHA